MKSRTMVLVMCSGLLINTLCAMDQDRTHNRWKKMFSQSSTPSPLTSLYHAASSAFYSILSTLRPAGSSQEPDSPHAPEAVSSTQTIDEQISSFFSTCGSSMAMARIERGTLIQDEHPTFYDICSYNWDASIVLGFVTDGSDATIIYATPEQWARTVILPGVCRDWVDRGLDCTKRHISAVRLYRQKERRVLELMRELPMTEQSQREDFMPTLIPPHESSIAVLAAAEGIVLDDTGTLSTEQRARLQSSVRETYGQSIEEIERSDKAAEEQTNALQEVICSTWIESLEKRCQTPVRTVPATTHAESIHKRLHDLHDHLMSTARDESRSMCDRVKTMYQKAATWNSLVAQASTSSPDVDRLDAEVTQAYNDLNGWTTSLWVTLKAEAQEIKDALVADPHRNRERIQQHYEHWLQMVHRTLGIVEGSAITTEQRTTIKQLEETFARAYQAIP